MLQRMNKTILDVMSTVSVSWSSDLFRLARLLHFRVPCIFVISNPAQIFFVIPENLSGKREARILMDAMEGKESPNHWTGHSTLNDPDVNGLLNILCDIPSVAIDGAYLENNSIKLRMRMNSAYAGKFASLVIEAVSRGVQVEIESLEPSKSSFDTQDFMETIIPLSVIHYRMNVPSTMNTMERNPMMFPWERVRKYLSLDDNLRSIYYVPESVKPIIDEEILEVIPGKLYETTTRNPFFRLIEKRMAEDHTLVVNYYMGYNGIHMFVEVVLPSIFVNNYIRFISEASREFPEWHPEIFGVKTYRDARDSPYAWNSVVQKE